MEQTATDPVKLWEGFKYLHGLFNFSVALLFGYQAALGLKIRAGRLGGETPRAESIRTHRRNGPILAGLGLLGFVAGATLVVLEEGEILEYPPHFFNGLLIVMVIGVLVAVSRKIRGAETPWRKRHWIAGLVLLVCYGVQILSGIAVILKHGKP